MSENTRQPSSTEFPSRLPSFTHPICVRAFSASLSITMTIQTSFSYDNFPNLWDEILSHASTEAKRDVRTVSRALRSAIDRRVRHLILTAGPPPQSEEDLDVADGAEAAAYDWRTGLTMPTFPVLQRIGAWGSEDDSFNCWGSNFDIVVPPWREQRALTRLTGIVDFFGYIHQWLHLGRISHLFTHLEVLRLTQDADGTFLFYLPFGADTVVLFPSPKGLEANMANPICKGLSGGRNRAEEPSILDAFWPEPPQPSELLVSMLPEAEPEMNPPLDVPRGIPFGVHRLVVNLDGHIGNPATSFHFLYDIPEHVAEIVFVLPHLTSLSGTGSVKGASAVDLVEVMRSSTARHTVVGCECVGVANFADEVREALKALTVHEPHLDVDYSIDDELTCGMSGWQRKSVASRAHALSHDIVFWGDHLTVPVPQEKTLSLKQKVDDRLSRLEFVTVEEYRRRVGEEAAALHLIQYPGL